MSQHQGLPVSGYRPQNERNVARVNQNKVREEELLRVVEQLLIEKDCDGRWLALARTHFEQGFMALNRAIFQPERIKLPGDD